MKKYYPILLILISSHFSMLSQQDSINIYLIPGQGADNRLFDSISVDGNFKLIHINYFTPERKIDMNGFARQLANQIDTTDKFILIGVSLGGMLASEMSTFLKPEKVILISSAKNRKELPFRYRFQKYVPLFEIFPPGVIKFGAKTLQPIIESDSKNNKATFKAMLADKDPKFLKRTIRMIVNWEIEEPEIEINHIHGTKDKTIPSRNVKCGIQIDEGSHMIVLTRFKEVNKYLNRILSGA